MKDKDIIEYVKANTHGEWQAEHQNGFKSKSKIHKSKKAYKRIKVKKETI